MSETPELPPLPVPFHTYAMPWVIRGEPGPREPFNYFTPEQVSAYGRECREAGRRAGLEEARRRMFDDVHARVQQIEDRYAMYEEGWFTGLMNGLDENSPRCAQTIKDAVRYFGELVSRMAARQALAEGRRAGLEEAAKLCGDAMRKSWMLGQSYWRLSSGESREELRQSEATQQLFEEFITETADAILEKAKP